MRQLFFTIFTALILFSCGDKNAKKENTSKEVETSEETPKHEGSINMVFFENDSLITQYQYSKDLDEKIRRKERSILAGRDQDMASYQEMYKTAVEKAPLMTTMEKQKVEQDLMAKEQQLMAKDQDTEQKYIKWKTDLLIEYQELLDSLLNQFRVEHNYDVLVPSGGGITKFYYAPSYDVTDTLVKYLNARYKPEESNN